jgi:hypothetical protein
MEDLITRVEKDLDNNWPVEATDIRGLIEIIRTLSDRLDHIQGFGGWRDVHGDR